MAIKGAKVSEYGGKSLNAGDEHSQLFLDPPGDKRSDELRKWYKSVTPEQLQSGTSMTTTRDNFGESGTDSKPQRADNFKLITELLEAV